MRRSPLAVLAAAVTFASAARADDASSADPVGTRANAFAIAAGVGSAYDLAGVHFELSSPKAALFVGTGVPAVLLRDSQPGSVHYDLAAGFRLFSGHRDGAFFSLQTLWSVVGDRATTDGGNPYGDPTHLKSLGVTVGWRLRRGHAFFEVGAGAMVIQFTRGCEGCGFPALLPDLSIGSGYQF
jgi:hypothetical protein